MKTFRQLVASERPLVLPGAHDAISARLIQRAGFKAYFIGGFPLVGASMKSASAPARAYRSPRRSASSNP